MRIQQFLEHHGIATNPFAEEDAQTDPVFKNRCRDNTFHPAWDKVFGDPSDPATSIVFGEKGAGKTALRLQVAGRVADYNAQHQSGRLWVIEYDDFNPFLDRFADRLSARKQRDASKVLAEWKLWDHMDSILSIAVTNLVDKVLGSARTSGPSANRIDGDPRAALDRPQKRDLLLLAAFYDGSLAEANIARWSHLRRRLRFYSPRAWIDKVIGVVVTAATIGLIVYRREWDWLATVWPYLAVAIGWAPWLARFAKAHFDARRVAKNVRVLRRDVPSVRRAFMKLSGRDVHGQPVPNKQRTDDRYELLGKLQGVLRSLGNSGIVVLVDRVDEPHLINGSVELMRDFVWSMLDNKFLKQPGIGFKLLLPSELMDHLHRETRDFHQRARLDKQNMVPSLDWSGEALFDLANARLAACAKEGEAPTLRSLLDPTISDQRLIDAFRSLRVPRHLFKFMYRLIVAHSNAHTDAQPVWTISRETFEAALAVYSREQAAVDRGLAV
jgi:hypothetical protein